MYTLRNFSKVAFLFCTIFASAIPAMGGNLCGNVVDPSGAVAPSAAVTLYSREAPSKLTTFTDEQGAFCFEDLPAGHYLAEASASGFGGSVVVTVSLGSEDIGGLEISLELSKVSTKVSITASSSAQSTDEIAKALNTVDASEIDRRAEFSIPETLRLTPGVRVQQLGGPGNQTTIRFRGMRVYDTAVLIDGFRFRDTSAPQGDATGFLEELLVVDTDRVEVLRGSGSSLYGSHATGGLVNIVTNQGGGPFHGSLDVEGGGLGMLRSAARFAGGAWNERLLYSAAATHLNVMKGIDDDDRTRTTSGHGFIQYRLSSASTLSGRIFANDSFLQLNDSPFAAPDDNLPASGILTAIPISKDNVKRLESGEPVEWGTATFAPTLNDPDNRRSSGFISMMVSLTHRLNHAASLRIAYQGMSTRRETRDGPGGVRYEPEFYTADKYDSRVDAADVRADLQAGRHQLISAGYEFEREHYLNTANDANPDVAQSVNTRSEATQNSHTVYLQDQVRLLKDRLQFSLSGRIQSFNLKPPQFEGGLPAYEGLELASPPNAYTADVSSAYIIPSSGTKFRVHVGNGYRAPSLFERFGTSFFYGSFSPYGDPRLRPERTIGADAGFDQYFASDRLRISATYFYTRLQEIILFDFSGIITPESDPFGRWGGYRNTGGGLARGVETSLEAKPTRNLLINSSYTYTKAQERVSATLDGSLRSFTVSDHMYTLLVTQHIRSRFDVTFDLMAASSYNFPFYTAAGSRAFRFDGPVKGDLVLSYTHPLPDARSLRLYTRVENILNRTYYEGGFYTPGIWATAGMKFQY